MAEEKINKTKLIVIGGSSGSLKVILRILAALRKDFVTPMLLVLHRNNQHESVLTELLSAKSFLPVKEVEEKDPLVPGTIYIAPQDYHVLLEMNGYFSLDYSEKMHYSRSSIDVSFISAAEACTKGLICILLSGANADGAEGLQEVKKLKGTTIVQDPADAEVDYMPRQAIEKGKIDFVMNTDQMINFLNAL